LRGKVEFK